LPKDIQSSSQHVAESWHQGLEIYSIAAFRSFVGCCHALGFVEDLCGLENLLSLIYLVCCANSMISCGGALILARKRAGVTKSAFALLLKATQPTIIPSNSILHQTQAFASPISHQIDLMSH
jgi:hypothetical protein